MLDSISRSESYCVAPTTLPSLLALHLSVFPPFILSLCIATTCISSFLFVADAQSTPTTKPVGVLLPLSGHIADQGEWCRQGIELFKEEAKLNDPSLLIEDTQADPKKALSAYKLLRERNHIDAVITFGSGVGVALTPVTNSDHVIQIGIATATPKYSTPDDYSFRTYPSATLEANFLAKEITTHNKGQSIVSLAIENDYGVGMIQAVTATLQAAGVSFARSVSYSPADTDFRSILTQIRALKPDLLYLASYPEDGALILRQARELGIKTPAIGSSAIVGGDNVGRLAGTASEGLRIVFTNASANFLIRYQHRFPNGNAAQATYAARAYDAIALITEATAQCAQAGGECLRTYLKEVRDYDGASGRFSFDMNGDRDQEFNFFEIREGQLQTAAP